MRDFLFVKCIGYSGVSNVDSKVHLQQISAEGHRSCKATTFAPHAQLSALIGINGTGKTNPLNSIRLLCVRAGGVNSCIQVKNLRVTKL